MRNKCLSQSGAVSRNDGWDDDGGVSLAHYNQFHDYQLNTPVQPHSLGRAPLFNITLQAGQAWHHSPHQQNAPPGCLLSQRCPEQTWDDLR